jgi:FKBP-type peptidyl-prolyl cis-trans isomerase
MKFSFFMAAAASLALVVPAARAQEKAASKAADSDFKDARQKASYGIGLSIGRSLKASFPDHDQEFFTQGLKDALGGKPARLTDQQIQEAVQTYQREIGQAFLAENAKKPGVKTLPSGLQYKVLKEGTGKTPKATDTVTVNYEGRLMDNNVFDSSAKTGQPARFQVGGVISGFREALLAMKAGSKWQVFIPANLAYGASPPAGSRIPPDAPLIFDLELLDVQEAAK